MLPVLEDQQEPKSGPENVTSADKVFTRKKRSEAESDFLMPKYGNAPGQ